MKLSDKLIELRKSKGWSQEEFAERVDVSRQAISRWENGTALPDAQNILRISKLFHVTADYLLNDDYEGERGDLAADPPPEEPVTDAFANMESEAEKVPPFTRRKPPFSWFLIPAVCFLILSVCVTIKVVRSANSQTGGGHSHSVCSFVKENVIAPTCKAEGSYDEVIYCTECEEELSRTTQSVAKLAHTLSESVKENEIVPTCTAEGSYDEVIYCTECEEELSRTTRSVAKLAHTLTGSVKENEIAPTCTAAGSYDEVVYCMTCDRAVLQTHRSVEKLAHQFQNETCVLCGEDQPSEGLLYMSNGNGTCFVSMGDCTDESVVIPSYSPNGEKVTQIKAYGFSGNNTAKSVWIPETVTAIGEGAFQDCGNLESVHLPSKITRILSYTFYGCEKLKDVTIPANVYYIGVEAFADCIACESITIPASVTKIGKFAFRNFSACQGIVTFEVYKEWKLYDDSDNCVDIMDFKNGIFSPITYLTFLRCEYTWKRA